MIIYNASGTPLVKVDVDDASYRYRALMREDTLTLEFALAEHLDLPVGCYCDFEAQRYTLLTYSNVVIRHRRNYEYRVTMSGPMPLTQNYIIYNPLDKRLRFELTATPIEHLHMVVDNLNARDGGGWRVGSYITAEPRTIAYNHTTCWDGIVQIANTFETEFEFEGKTIHLGKVEYHKSDPLALGYGKGNGLRPGINRISSSMPIGKVYIQGGDRNIGLDNYDAKTLHLPKNTTFRFNGTTFVDSGGVLMHTDSDGSSVYLDSAASNATEASLDLTDIYPKRIGTVSGVVYEYRKQYFSSREALFAAFPEVIYDDELWESVFVHFYDSTMPASLNYEDCMMGDQPLTVIFQSGELIGREFNVTFKKDPIIQVDEDDPSQIAVIIPQNRFEIEFATIDGVIMPSKYFFPSAEDTYAIFNCALPQAYINAGAQSKEGAEWDALKEAAKFLYENMDPRVAYRGDLDPIFAKDNWLNVGGYLKCGSYISFSDPAVQSTPVSVRIVGVRQYVNNPYSPTIEFSNDVVSPTLTSVLQQLKAQETKIEEGMGYLSRFSARSWHNAKETASMLIKAALDGFSAAINPIAVETMQMIVGAEYLQFRFIRAVDNPSVVKDTIVYSPETKTLSTQASVIQHMTLGIDKITSAEGRPLSDYMIWSLPRWQSAVLDDPQTPYYLYVNVPHGGGEGSWDLTPDRRVFKVMGEPDPETGEASVVAYNLLVGILNSEEDYDRSFARLYGFTEILPGQVTTDRIVSADGLSYFDFVANEMRFGDDTRSFSWNLPRNGVPSHQFRITGGTIIQSSGTEDTFPMTCFRGDYNANTTYYFGDEVNYIDGCSYVYVNDQTPSTGRTPSDDGVYWRKKNVTGTSAKLINLIASSLFFAFADSEAQAPIGDTEITLTAQTQNIGSPTFAWSYWNGTSWTTVSGATTNTLTIGYNHAGFIGQMLKVRVSVVGDNTLYDEVALYKVYGGKDGENIFIADLDNDMEGVELASSGRTTAQTVLTTTGVLHFGNVAQVLTSAAAVAGTVPTGVTVSVSYNQDHTEATFSITVPANTSLSASQNIDFTLTSATGSGTTTFTLLGVRPGTDGSPATFYSLLPSAKVISRDSDNVVTPSTLSCEVMKRSGTDAYTDGSADGILRYYINDSSTPTTYTGAISIPSDGTIDKVVFEFVLNSQVVDRETIFVVDDGEEAISAFLTNPVHTFAGTETSAALGTDTFDIIVFRGITQLTYGTSYNYNETSITGTTQGQIEASVNSTTGAITVSVYPALTADSGELTINVAVSGYGTIPLKYQWLVSKIHRGKTGKTLRGPTYWEAGREYLSGDGDGELYQDLVTIGGDTYICQVSHTSQAGAEPYTNPTDEENNPLWKQFSRYEYVATKVILAEGGKIDKLQVTELTTEQTVSSGGNDILVNPINISKNTITVKNVDPTSTNFGQDVMTITTDALPTSEDTSRQYTLSSESTTVGFSAPGSAAFDTTVNLGSVGSSTYPISGANNSVSLPNITLRASIPSGTSIVCYYYIEIGGRYLASGSVPTSSNGTTVSFSPMTLPQGIHPVTVRFTGAFYADSGSGQKTATLSAALPTSGNTASVTYSAEYTVFAADGMQMRYGDEGFRASSTEGTKLIQDGHEYNAAGIGSIETGLTPPKRFIFCYSYPAAGYLDDDAVYIKITPSS